MDIVDQSQRFKILIFSWLLSKAPHSLQKRASWAIKSTTMPIIETDNPGAVDPATLPHDSLKNGAIACSVVCVVIATVFVALRLYTRMKIVKVVAPTDWLLLAALVCQKYQVPKRTQDSQWCRYCPMSCLSPQYLVRRRPSWSLIETKLTPRRVRTRAWIPRLGL
jgi:hypothetical protein